MSDVPAVLLGRAAEGYEERRQGGDAGLLLALLVGCELRPSDARRGGELVLPTAAAIADAPEGGADLACSAIGASHAKRSSIRSAIFSSFRPSLPAKRQSSASSGSRDDSMADRWMTALQ